MTDSVLIIGGGVSGLHAARKCAQAGAHVIVAEKGPVVGGHFAACMGDSRHADRNPNGQAIPSLSDFAKQADVEIFTLTELTELTGRAGSYEATLSERARFVTDTCSRCNHCRAACPVVTPNEYDAGLSYRKAIYTPASETLPTEYVIDIDHCLNTPPNYLPCNRCVSVCDDNSIHFDLAPLTTHVRNVASVIVATGFESGDTASLSGLGFGLHPDVVTSSELQRMLTAPGPTGGFAVRPSCEEYPDSALIVLDELSAFALSVAANHAHRLIEQGIPSVDILILDQAGPDANEIASRLSKETGDRISLCHGGMFKVKPDSAASPAVTFEDFDSGKHVEGQYDLVVLWAEPAPNADMRSLADVCGIALKDDGYVAAPAAPGLTTRSGVLIAGCAAGPRMLDTCISDADIAADAALECMDARLLKPGYAPGEMSTPESTPSDPNMRTNIERMLFALIDSA